MAQTIYGPAEAAERLGVSMRTLWRLIREGELSTVQYHPKPGLKSRQGITATELEAFIKERANVA